MKQALTNNYYHKYGWSKKGISIEEKKSGLRYSGIKK